MKIAGAQTLSHPLEVSRTPTGPHSWHVVYSDGSTSEDISWYGCWKPEKLPMAEQVKRIREKRKR